MFQDGYPHTMQEDYDRTIEYSSLLWTCVETLWPPHDHYFRQSWYIFQHILENSLETIWHETLFFDNFQSADTRLDGSCKSLGSTTNPHVQPQASSSMGWYPSIHTTQLQSCSTRFYGKESIWDLLWISTLSAYWLNQFLDTVEWHLIQRMRSGERFDVHRPNIQHPQASIGNVSMIEFKS